MIRLQKSAEVTPLRLGRVPTTPPSPPLRLGSHLRHWNRGTFLIPTQQSSVCSPLWYLVGMNLTGAVERRASHSSLTLSIQPSVLFWFEAVAAWMVTSSGPQGPSCTIRGSLHWRAPRCVVREVCGFKGPSAFS